MARVNRQSCGYDDAIRLYVQNGGTLSTCQAINLPDIGVEFTPSIGSLPAHALRKFGLMPIDSNHVAAKFADEVLPGNAGMLVKAEAIAEWCAPVNDFRDTRTAGEWLVAIDSASAAKLRAERMDITLLAPFNGLHFNPVLMACLLRALPDSGSITLFLAENGLVLQHESGCTAMLSPVSTAHDAHWIARLDTTGKAKTRKVKAKRKIDWSQFPVTNTPTRYAETAVNSTRHFAVEYKGLVAEILAVVGREDECLARMPKGTVVVPTALADLI